MFLGSFLANTSSLDATPVHSEDTALVEITNGVFDDVYMDSDTTLEYSTTIPEWDYTTILHARFQDNILAGNVNFTLSTISALVLKRRKKGAFMWTPLYSQPVTQEEDLDFYFNDITVASNTTYEYAAVPIINMAEGTYQITSVDVEFDGAFVIDPTYGYQIIANLQRSSLTRNNPSSLIEPINSKYPYVNYYGQSQYDKFTLSGMFIEMVNNCRANEDVYSWQLRKSVRDFLTNRRSKVVKLYDGQIYLASVIDTIQESENQHIDYVNTTINFVEVGDVDNGADLYYHGFSNYLEVGV